MARLVHADVRNEGYFKTLCRDLERMGVQPPPPLSERQKQTREAVVFKPEEGHEEE
jgi:hypothetical protein